MTWGQWGKQFSTAQMADLITFSLEQGITTFDHADIYGDYTTEQEFGKAFKATGIARESIQLVTKFGIQMTSRSGNRVKHYQYDAAYILKCAEQSLQKLKTDYIDLLLLHRPSPLMHPDEIAEATQRLLAAGKIKQFGVSNVSPSQMGMLETAQSIAANQVEFSLTHCDPMYDGTFDDCIQNDRTAMAWSPLGGFFRENNTQNQRIQTVLDTLKPKYDADENQLLLAFVLKHPAAVHPVIGTTNKKRIAAALQAVNITLQVQDWFLLLQASQGHEAP